MERLLLNALYIRYTRLWDNMVYLMTGMTRRSQTRPIYSKKINEFIHGRLYFSNSHWFSLFFPGFYERYRRMEETRSGGEWICIAGFVI